MTFLLAAMAFYSAGYIVAESQVKAAPHSKLKEVGWKAAFINGSTLDSTVILRTTPN